MAQKKLAHIIAEIEKCVTEAEQVETLLKYSSSSLKHILGHCFDPNVMWLLPAGTPPYRSAPVAGDLEGALYSQTRLLPYFVNGEVGKQLTQIKREQMFVGLLESVDAEDAALVIRMKDHQIKIRVSAIRKAFPKLTAGWVDDVAVPFVKPSKKG